MSTEVLIERLKKADEVDLDFSKVSWVEKADVITLKEQSRVLVESLQTFKDEDLNKVVKTAEEFLKSIVPVVTYINRVGVV
jgi:hypothetical protein